MKAIIRKIVPEPILRIGYLSMVKVKDFPTAARAFFLNTSYAISARFHHERNPLLHMATPAPRDAYVDPSVNPRQFRRVIIWGSKNFSNTFYHIDMGYFRAFQALGFETYYFDNRRANDYGGFDFEHSLFLTEGNNESNIPLVKSAQYIFHYVNTKKYDERGLRYINFANYMKQCDAGDSPHYPGGHVTKIGETTFWDEEHKTLYQPWATDLLPHEIDTDTIVDYDDRRKNIYYIGAVYPHNRDQMMAFAQAAQRHGKKFVPGKLISDARAFHLVRDSYVSIDLRGPWHVECGYIPCRVYKNISYGKFTGVNSENIAKQLGQFVAYDPDPAKLFDVTAEAYRTVKRETMVEAMEYVRQYHTYITRAKHLLNHL